MKTPTVLAPFSPPPSLTYAEYAALFDALGKISWNPSAPDRLVWISGQQGCVVRHRDPQLRFHIDIIYSAKRRHCDGLVLGDGTVHTGDAEEITIHHIALTRR